LPEIGKKEEDVHTCPFIEEERKKKGTKREKLSRAITRGGFLLESPPQKPSEGKKREGNARLTQSTIVGKKEKKEEKRLKRCRVCFVWG